MCICCVDQVKQSRKKPLQVKTPRALPTMEAHQVIRANALFLLSLSSAAEPSLLCHHPPKPFHTNLPSLKEGVSEELPNKIGCLYLQTLARYIQHYYLRFSIISQSDRFSNFLCTLTLNLQTY